MLAKEIIDARGRSCPEPVIMTKNALESSAGNIEVLVDAEVAKENVKRFAENKGYKVSISENEEDYAISITK
jgi:tRNA 2-thiouridine synthesizing protein A